MDYTGVYGYDLPLGICVLVALNLAFRLAAFVCISLFDWLLLFVSKSTHLDI